MPLTSNLSIASPQLMELFWARAQLLPEHDWSFRAEVPQRLLMAISRMDCFLPTGSPMREAVGFRLKRGSRLPAVKIGVAFSILARADLMAVALRLPVLVEVA